MRRGDSRSDQSGARGGVGERRVANARSAGGRLVLRREHRSRERLRRHAGDVEYSHRAVAARRGPQRLEIFFPQGRAFGGKPSNGDPRAGLLGPNAPNAMSSAPRTLTCSVARRFSSVQAIGACALPGRRQSRQALSRLVRAPSTLLAYIPRRIPPRRPFAQAGTLPRWGVQVGRAAFAAGAADPHPRESGDHRLLLGGKRGIKSLLRPGLQIHGGGIKRGRDSHGGALVRPLAEKRQSRRADVAVGDAGDLHARHRGEAFCPVDLRERRTISWRDGSRVPPRQQARRAPRR